MMKVDELVAIKGLYPLFSAECCRVAEILAKTKKYCNANNCSSWTISDDEVCGDGYDCYGDSASCYFPLDYLTKTDEELQEIVALCLQEENDELERQKKKREEDVRNHELSELKRLQEKYKDI